MSEAYLKQLTVSHMTWDEAVIYFEKMRSQIEKWNAENAEANPVEVAYHQAVLNKDMKAAYSILIDYESFQARAYKKPRWLEEWTVPHLPMIRRMVEALPS